MQSEDISNIVFAVCAIFISVPLMLLLWRAYTMMDRVNRLLEYADHLRELASQFESVPMKILEGILSNFSGNSSWKK